MLEDQEVDQNEMEMEASSHEVSLVCVYMNYFQLERDCKFLLF